MTLLFIRYLFITICIFFIYSKIFESKLSNIAKQIILPIFILLISFVSCLLIDYSVFSRITILFLSTYIFAIIFYRDNYFDTLIKLVISFEISFVSFYLTATLVTIIFLYVYKTANMIPYNLNLIITNISQLLLVIFLMRIKRLRHGINSIVKNKYANNIIFLSLLFMITIIYTNTPRKELEVKFIAIISLLSFSIFLLFYWRHRITQMYREKLRKANERSMLDEINEHKLTIEKLQADNKRLASIVHADNKLIPAMLTSVTAYLENHDNLTSDELASRGLELSEQLKHMTMNRQGIIDLHPKETSFLPKSGLHTVDGMLSFMETRAKENHITYKVTIDENIKETALAALSEEDLLRLLGDLIDNAIIAIKHSDDMKAILIHMGALQNHFLLEISDSGIPFSIETYQHFGNEQHTTHGDNGGSGIGLMDIWKIKKNYKASLHIYEYPNDLGIYTKKISFLFDRKNHFLLQTNRYKEIMKELTRGDLYVFPYQLK